MNTPDEVRAFLAQIGAKGGRAKSERKAAAARANGKRMAEELAKLRAENPTCQRCNPTPRPVLLGTVPPKGNQQ